mgnify:CR=1 FL=1
MKIKSVVSFFVNVPGKWKSSEHTFWGQTDKQTLLKDSQIRVNKFSWKTK